MNKQNKNLFSDKQTKFDQTKSVKQNNNFFAEVIESSLDNFLAQSWQWDFFPSFGSLIQVESKKNIILGVVTQVQTGSMDPMRYPFPYQKTEEELLREQPQIFEFLKTTFRIQIVGYIDQPLDTIFSKEKITRDERSAVSAKSNGCPKIFYMLPPKPCKIHAFVQNASAEIITSFFNKSDFLYLLFSFSASISNLDELLLAIFKQLFKNKMLSANKLDSFCQTFSLLTGNDYRRLKLFLKRVEFLR